MIEPKVSAIISENRCIEFHSQPHQYSILLPFTTQCSVFNFVYSVIARLINFAHDFTFDSNRMSRDAVNRVCHTSSHRVKTSSDWLIKSDTITLQCLWHENIFIFFMKASPNKMEIG